MAKTKTTEKTEEQNTPARVEDHSTLSTRTRIPFDLLVQDDRENVRLPELLDLGKIGKPGSFVDSIFHEGLKKPLVVQEIEENGKHTGHYLIKSGNRRYRGIAMIRAAFPEMFEEVTCDVFPHDTDPEIMFSQLADHANTLGLTFYEKAQAVSRAMKIGLSQEKAAAILKMSRGTAQVADMLNRLPAEIKNAYRTYVAGDKEKGVNITQTDIRALNTAKLSDKKGETTGELEKVWARIKKGEKNTGAEVRSQKEVEEMREQFDGDNPHVCTMLDWFLKKTNDLSQFSLTEEQKTALHEGRLAFAWTITDEPKKGKGK